MSRISNLFIGVLVGAAVQVACSDRKTTEEPDREALCAKACAQLFGPCNPSPPQGSGGDVTEEYCNTECVADKAWDGPCRFKYAEKVTCSNELSCDDFMVQQTDVANDPCLEAENAWASCL